MTTYRAELIRARNRGTYWFLGLCLGLFLFGMVNAKPQHHAPLYGFRQASILVATLIMGRAVTVAAGDFSGGTIRPWLISAPRRGAVCLGKLTASLTIAAAFCVVAGVVGFAMSSALGTVPTFADVASVAGELLLACLGFIAGGDYAAVLAHVFTPFIVIEAVAVVFFLRRDVNG